jgi:hypothetical protein
VLPPRVQVLVGDPVGGDHCGVKPTPDRPDT